MKEEGMQMQKREREKKQACKWLVKERTVGTRCVCVCVCVREGEVYLVRVDREAGLAEHLPDLGNKRGTPYTQHETQL